MHRMLAIAALGFSILAVPPAHATGPGQPFGNGNTGCTPDTRAHLQCADKLITALNRLLLTLTTCHKEQVDYCFYQTIFDFVGCEATGKAAFDKRVASAAPLCSQTQLDDANAYAAVLLADSTTPGSLKARNAESYCDPTTGKPLEKDLSGFLPPTATVNTQEGAVWRNLRTLANAVLRCHKTMADTTFAGRTFDDGICSHHDPLRHRAALDKYDVFVDRTTAKAVPPSCIDNASQKALGDAFVAKLENDNAMFYPCP